MTTRMKSSLPCMYTSITTTASRFSPSRESARALRARRQALGPARGQPWRIHLRGDHIQPRTLGDPKPVATQTNPQWQTNTKAPGDETRAHTYHRHCPGSGHASVRVPRGGGARHFGMGAQRRRRSSYRGLCGRGCTRSVRALAARSRAGGIPYRSHRRGGARRTRRHSGAGIDDIGRGERAQKALRGPRVLRHARVPHHRLPRCDGPHDAGITRYRHM